MNATPIQEAAMLLPDAAPKPETPGPSQAETAWLQERDRFFQEQKEVVDLSIALHGGPYEGCPECGAYAADTFEAGGFEAKRRMLAQWARHIAAD